MDQRRQRPTAIELRSISGKGIKAFFNLFQKPSLYAAVSLGGSPDRKQKQKQKTPVDRQGGENPEWDHPIRLDLDIDVNAVNLAIEFELKAQRILGDSTVGRARIPLADLDLTAGAVRQASYQVRSPEGKPNGVLSFSYQIDGPEASRHPVVTVEPPPVPAMGYPAAPEIPSLSSKLSNREAVKYPAVWDPIPPPSAVEHYPPPSAPVFGIYPPPPPPDPALVSFVPQDYEHRWSAQPPVYSGAGHYPPPPPPAYSAYPPQPAPAGYYPPQPAPACCYPPQPEPACCYPEAQYPYGYRREGCDRGLYGYH